MIQGLFFFLEEEETNMMFLLKELKLMNSGMLCV